MPSAYIGWAMRYRLYLNNQHKCKGIIVMNESCELCGKETNGSLLWLCKDNNGDYKDYVCICTDCDDKQTEKEL